MKFAASMLALFSVTAFAQVGGNCTQTNTINFCVNENTDGLPNSNAGRNEAFGAALAFGDFDGDGFPDLAVGVPVTTTIAAPCIFIAGPRQTRASRP